ncbi:MAG: Gfo/Idh/MocA family protein [Chthoniobacterales bacterium]
MDQIRVGFIGAGANTVFRHLPGFQSLSCVNCAVVANRTEESSKRVADAFGIPRIANHWRDVIADKSVDAVCVGTWPDMHAEITVAALRAGKHVLVEARMARNIAESMAMCAALEDAPKRLVAQIVPAPFSLNHDATVRRLLPTLGAIHEARITFCNAIHVRPEVPISWRQDATISGVNTATLGILYETLQRWIGPMNPAWIAATARTFTRERPDGNGGLKPVTVPDSVTVLGHYSSGTALVAHVTTIASGRPISEIRLDGAKGTLRMDFLKDALFLSDTGAGDELEIHPDPGTTPGWRVEADFVDSIAGGLPVTLTSFADGLRYMTFTELAHQSWESDGVRLNWPSIKTTDTK